MRIARLAATMTAAGVLALAGATPVFAAGLNLAGSTATTPSPSGDPSGGPSEEPTPTPTETTPTPTPTETTPSFDADITPHVFSPGDRLTLNTTGCPTVPTVEDVDALFTGPLALEESGEQQHSGSAVTKSNLSATKTYHVVVTCKDVGSITFSAVPGKKTTKHHGGQTGVVPVGGVATGDGSSVGGGSGTVLAMAGGVSAVAMATALTLAYRRRKVQEDA